MLVHVYLSGWIYFVDSVIELWSMNSLEMLQWQASPRNKRACKERTQDLIFLNQITIPI